MCTLGVCCALWSAVITDRSKVINWPSDGRVHSAFDEHFLVSFFLWPFQIVSFPNPSLCRNQLENPDDNDGDVSPQCNLVTGCWVASCPELDSVDPQLVFHCIALSPSSTSLDARRMKMTKMEKCFSDVLWHLVMRPIIRDCCDWYTFKVMRLLQLQVVLTPSSRLSPQTLTHIVARSHHPTIIAAIIPLTLCRSVQDLLHWERFSTILILQMFTLSSTCINDTQDNINDTTALYARVC